MKYRVLIAESVDENVMAEMQTKTKQVQFDYKPDLTVAALEEEIAAYDGLIVRPKIVTATAIANAKKLRLIIRGGSGVNSIALDAAKARGIVVENTPSLNAQATAEFTFLMMMELFCRRQIARASMLASEGAAGKPEDFMGNELFGKKLGVVGFGEVGKRMGFMATCFGMEVTVLARTPSELPVEQVRTLPELLRGKHDIISLHVPLTPQTKGMIGKKEFAMLGANTTIVNTARPQLIDVEAFAEALKTDKIAGYGIDGDQEQIQPFIDADPFGMGICTHHIADCTYEAHYQITHKAMAQAIEFFEHGKEYNRVV